MTLVEHLRELRTRTVKSMLAIVVAGGLSLLYYEPLLKLFLGPFERAVTSVQVNQGIDAKIVFDGIADPFSVPLKLAMLAGITVASPVWIYQLWAFIMPALYKKERRYAATAVVTAAPLFLLGVFAGYKLLPGGLTAILGFTPEDVSNYISFPRYFTFLVRLELVFGFSFLLPVFLVLANSIGALSARSLAHAWRWTVFGIVVFAAVATPTGDPFTMSLLAAPMVGLYLLSVGICWVNDRRRARKAGSEDFSALDDDEMSYLASPSKDIEDDQPSLDDDDRLSELNLGEQPEGDPVRQRSKLTDDVT